MLPVFVKARVLSEVIPEGRAHIVHGTSNCDRNQGNETSMRKLSLAKGLSKTEMMVIFVCHWMYQGKGHAGLRFLVRIFEIEAMRDFDPLICFPLLSRCGQPLRHR